MDNSERDSSFLASHGHGFIRTAVATPRVYVGDPVRNGEAILKLAAQASEGDVDIVDFPELSLSAYAIDDLFLQEALLQAVEQAVVDLAEASRDLAPVLLVGAPLRRGSALYNCAVVLSRGEILGVVP
jgi:NAD+ synthase (glutamine-hydrolysing)